VSFGASADRPAEYRYGVVLVLALILVIFQIVAPADDWSRAVFIALEAGALSTAVATARERREIRRLRAITVAVAGVIIVVGVASDLISAKLTFLLATLLALAIPVTLIGGLVRLIRSRGVTVPAVSGALAIYLVVGLLFASAISFVTYLGSGPYFAQGTDGSAGDRVYFSFTVMTTTGFGDFTPATAVGHALAVLEMLVGQLYLVTVIGILVGNLARRP
jgi:Ion channel